MKVEPLRLFVDDAFGLALTVETKSDLSWINDLCKMVKGGGKLSSLRVGNVVREGANSLRIDLIPTSFMYTEK